MRIATQIMGVTTNVQTLGQSQYTEYYDLMRKAKQLKEGKKNGTM